MLAKTDEALLQRIRQMARERPVDDWQNSFFIRHWRKQRRMADKCDCPACWLRREHMDKDFDCSPCPKVWRVIKHGV